MLGGLALNKEIYSMMHKSILNEYKARYISRNHDETFFKKSTFIREELLKRDFTKRQLNILWFIYRYSFFYGKEEAIITHLSDFELCGVHRTKIKEELLKLEEMNVIGIDLTIKSYWIKEPTKWKTPYHKDYDSKRARELFLLNLRDSKSFNHACNG